MNSYLNIAEGILPLRALHSPVTINVPERVSGLTFIREPSAKMRALLVLFFVWTWGHCLPAPAGMQRQDTTDFATSVEVDNFDHLFNKAAAAAPKPNQWEDLRKLDDEIPVGNIHFKRSVNVDAANKKVTVKVPCRRTNNNPCLGSEIYEFVLLNAKGLVT